MSTPTPEEILEQKLYLKNIGTSLKDFEEVKKGEKKYFILGYGNFGYAEKMKGKDNKYYAVKKLDKKSEKFNKRDFKRETLISIKLLHENLVRFYGYFEDKEKIEKFKEIKLDLINKNRNKFRENIDLIKNSKEDKEIYCLVTEFAQNGSLGNYIDKYKTECIAKEGHFVPLEQNIVIKFLEQILSALIYLHKQKIAHRDIKPDNILLDENNNIKVSDLAIDAIFKEEDNIKTGEEDDDLLAHCSQVGKINFICPEIEQAKSFDYRCDIYSLGLTILCLMAKDKPVIVIKDPINPKLKFRKLRAGIWDNLSCYNKYLIKLIKRMLEEDINYRPTSKQCYDELQYIKQIIKNPSDEVANRYLQSKNKEKVSEGLKIKIPELKNQSLERMQTQQYNQYNNNICNNNMYNNKMYNNNMNNNNTSASNNIYFRGNTYDYSYVNPINPYYPNNQGFTMLPANNQSSFVNNINFYQNFSKNSSIASVIQCLRYCFNDFDLKNFKFFTEEKKLFSYDIATLIEKVNIENLVNFKNSIQNFRNKASINIPKYYYGTEEIEPILALFGICDYINKEFRETNNLMPNLMYQNFEEMKDIPKDNFPHVYKIIEKFKNNYHSPFVNNFYYILLNLVKCPKCNYILNAEIKDNYGISSFIPLNGSFIDKVSNLFEQYISRQFDSYDLYYCKNCDYSGPGKYEIGFLNTPKYLLFDFGEPKDIKTLDDSIDLTDYSLEKSKNNKYNILCFITKEEDKFRAYIKNKRHIWCAYNEENIIEEDVLIIKYKCIPYIAIYEKEL